MQCETCTAVVPTSPFQLPAVFQYRTSDNQPLLSSHLFPLVCWWMLEQTNLFEKDCKAECTCCKLQWWVPERCLSVRSLQMLFNFMLGLYPKMEMRWQSSTNLPPPSLRFRLKTALAPGACASKLYETKSNYDWTPQFYKWCLWSLDNRWHNNVFNKWYLCKWH